MVLQLPGSQQTAEHSGSVGIAGSFIETLFIRLIEDLCKGLTVRTKLVTATAIATAAASALLGGAIVAAGPAGAHADDALIQYHGPDPLWVMPDLNHKILAQAEQEVEADVEQMPLKINVVAPNQARVYSPEDWVVCGESPDKGSPLSAKSTSVTLQVGRPGGQYCGNQRY